MAQMKKPMPKKPTAKPVSPAKKKLMPLTGPAAVEALQRRVSPSGVKKAEMDAKKAIAKKYPGLTKSTATKTVSKASAEKPKATKRAPLETKRVGGIVSVPVKPKKTVY